MGNSIDSTVLKLTNRYVVYERVEKISLGYRIGIGKIIQVYNPINEETVQAICEDARPYTVYIYE